MTSTFKEAKETAWLVAYWAAAFAGNVACTASPTRNTLKSQRKFSCPAVWIRQPKELRMKRLLGLLLVMGMGMGMVRCGDTANPSGCGANG